MIDITPKRLAVIDRHDTHGSLTLLADQINQAWTETRAIVVPPRYRRCRQIIVVGMGGSGFPAEMLAAVFSDKLSVPLTVVNGYSLPYSVGPDSLVVLSSFSGTTEEVLACAHQVRQRRCQVMVVTSGGQLAQLARRSTWSSYIFEPRFNPSGQPREGTGYLFTGLLGLLRQAGYVRVTDQQVKALISGIRRRTKKLSVTQPQSSNPAKQLAAKLLVRLPLLVASEHLLGAVHGFRNQINENAKHLAMMFPLPELNHHLLEGLRFPALVRQSQAVLFESQLYHQRNQRRYGITADVLKRSRVPAIRIRLTARTKLEQNFELFQFGGFVSLYLAVLHHLDPSAIPWVDYFKAALAKQ